VTDDAAFGVLDRVGKSFAGPGRGTPDIVALQDVSYSFKQGELVALLGPSGCGKTTLLRIIGGFEEPTAGEVLIAGRDVLSDPPYRRRTNMIFQHLALFPHMSVAENVAFGLEMKKLDQGKIKAKVGSMNAATRLGRGPTMYTASDMNTVAKSSQSVNRTMGRPIGLTGCRSIAS